SGSVAANERPEFSRLLDRLEPGDVLVVTKLDRLGRNAMDIRKRGVAPISAKSPKLALSPLFTMAESI
ncbi:recombinase family protein, partial [Vibrio parahaemolyticus]